MNCHVNPLLPVELSIEPLISLTCKHHSEKKYYSMGLVLLWSRFSQLGFGHLPSSGSLTSV